MPKEVSSCEPEAALSVESLLNKELQVVTGKGGVGRTVVSLALALRSARQGKRTLLLEVNAPDSAARYLRVRPSIDQPTEALDRLWLCRMTPAGSLKEYALMILKFRAVYNLVFENRLVRYLLRSIPSLPEFTMLGKTWYHGIEKRPDGTPKYDRIIVDAPATGHATTFLGSARTVSETMPKGIMSEAAERMASYVESDNTCFHLVATPEDMPVTEGIQFMNIATGRLRMRPGLAVMNRYLDPFLSPQEADAASRLPGGQVELAPYLSALSRRTARETRQKECLDRFAREAGLPLVVLPELEGAERIDAEWIARLISYFDEAEARDG